MESPPSTSPSLNLVSVPESLFQKDSDSATGPNLPILPGLPSTFPSRPNEGSTPNPLSTTSPGPPSGLPPIRSTGFSPGLPPKLPPGLPPLPPPPFALPTHSCPRCRDILRIQKHLRRRRTELLTLRAHFRNEQSLLAQIREFDTNTRQSVVDALSIAVDRGSLADDLEMIKTLQQKSLIAHDNLNKAEKSYNKLRFRLSGLEYHFGKKEEKLNSLISQHQLDDDDDDIDDGPLESNVLIATLDDVDSANQSESDYMPSLLAEYYDKAGDVGIEWERLQELDAEYRKNTILRERGVAEGRGSMPPEQEVISKYLDERAKIVRRYLQAKADARGLRRQCEEREYSIQDDGSNRDMDDHDFSIGATDLEYGRHNDPKSASRTDRLLQIFLLGEVNRGQRMDAWLKGSVQPQTTATTSSRAPLWESRQAYSELGHQVEPETPVLLAQSETGLEPRAEREASMLEEEIAEGTAEYPQTWPALTRVESTLSGVPMSIISSWQPEVSLEHRYSSPELRQLARAA
jgi:hypothetical protein